MTSASLPNGQSVNYSHMMPWVAEVGGTSNNQTTRFIYDGQDVVQDRQGATIQADYINDLEWTQRI